MTPTGMTEALQRLPMMLGDPPISDFDRRLTGAEVAWFREGIASPGREDPYWVTRDFAEGVSKVDAPVQLIGGWYDIFLPWLLEDFAALNASGHDVRLVLGPWTHTAPGLMGATLPEGTAWLRARLLDDDRLLNPARIRVRLTGERPADGWRGLPARPPPRTEG